MWIAVEVPDECESQIRRCIEWLHSPEHQLSSIGASMVVNGQIASARLAVRVLDMEISGREFPGDMSDLSRI